MTTSTSVPEEIQERCGGWNKYSESKLISLEKNIFQVLRTAYTGWHVAIDHIPFNKSGKPKVQAKIWTIGLNVESKKTPLILLHGFGAGVAYWCLNLDHLATERPVYAIDILGFGRSSRIDLSSDPLKAEQEFVASIENWRKKLKLDKVILLGHSMGGYLATCYSIAHPEHVKHLILADPWGFVGKPDNFNPPLLIKTLAVLLYPLTALNPLATVRAAGPLGPWIVRKMRSDIAYKYSGWIENHEIISDYIYQCNSQSPTGESAFHKMFKGFAWAKHPMIDRVHKLDDGIPITIMQGENSWMDATVGEKLKDVRKDSYVRTEIIPQAGHHINADNPACFNEIVASACTFADNSDDKNRTEEKENIEPIEEISQ